MHRRAGRDLDGMTAAPQIVAAGAAVGFAGLAVLGQADLAAWIGQVGFPIAVATFLLIRLERVLSRLVARIDALDVRGCPLVKELSEVKARERRDASGEG